VKYKYLNYLIIVQPDKRTGAGEACYSVYCPNLGLADSGDTIEEAIDNMQKLIGFHLGCF
jgi:predicted RNase H-like HicB family nuclease